MPGPCGSVEVDDHHVEAPVGFLDVFDAVIDHEIEALVLEHRSGEFGEMLLGEFDHRGVDLDLRDALDRFVLEHFLGDAAIAAADDQHFLGVAVRQDRHVRHHLVIDELVRGGDLGGAVQHQHFAEMLLLEQDQMVVAGLLLVEHPLDLEGHAEAEIVEQRFRNPAFFSHGTPHQLYRRWSYPPCRTHRCQRIGLSTQKQRAARTIGSGRPC